MRYSFRLAELIGHVPDPRKRPGTIKSIVEHTGLDRHQVAALLKNEMKYIPMSAISRLCDYLIEHGHAGVNELPGALFAVEAESFWEMLARRRRLDICLGVQPDDIGVENASSKPSAQRSAQRSTQRSPQPSADGAVLRATDSLLQAAVLNGLCTLGGGASHPSSVRQTLTWSFQLDREVAAMDRARQIYDDFAQTSRDKALVCIGGPDENPLTELVIARAFGCEPFCTVENISKAAHRGCPIFLRRAAGQAMRSSCWSGSFNPTDQLPKEAGFYFETPSGQWRGCPCDGHRDAAMVLFLHRESLGRLEMVLCGYSSRSARLLAHTLLHRAEDFWPPVYQAHGIQLGAFVVEYQLDPHDDKSREFSECDPTPVTHIIPLSPEVVERRWESHHTESASTKPS